MMMPLKEIYNLQVFFQLLPQPELQLSSLLLNGHILRKVGKSTIKLDVLWQAHDALKDHKNLFMYVSLLYAMGATYADSGIQYGFGLFKLSQAFL